MHALIGARGKDVHLCFFSSSLSFAFRAHFLVSSLPCSLQPSPNLTFKWQCGTPFAMQPTFVLRLAWGQQLVFASFCKRDILNWIPDKRDIFTPHPQKKKRNGKRLCETLHLDKNWLVLQMHRARNYVQGAEKNKFKMQLINTQQTNKQSFLLLFTWPSSLCRHHRSNDATCQVRLPGSLQPIHRDLLELASFDHLIGTADFYHMVYVALQVRHFFFFPWNFCNKLGY